MSVEWLEPSDIEISGRFDIVAKYRYARAFASGTLSASHERAYREHIRVFNASFEERENGQPKIGGDDFVDDFNKLLASIRDNGFDEAHPVTIDPNNWPLDGAHRVAAALALEAPIAIVRTSRAFPGKWHFRFFRERGMAPESLDFSAASLGALWTPLRAIILYGSALHRAEPLTERFSECGEILYERRVELTRVGCDNLIRVLYDGERWLGRKEFGYLGAASKARPCFPESAPRAALVLWLSPNIDHEQLIEAKEEARKLVGLGKHSLHVTDTDAETQRLSQWILNPNARHALNHRSSRYMAAFERDIADLERRIKIAPESREHICVVGSSVMAVYGLRDARDLDIIDASVPSESGQESSIGLKVSNGYLEGFGFDVKRLAYDPANHFWYRGIKILALERLAQLKAKRGEAKDEIDLALIRDILPRPGSINRKIARAALLLRLYGNAKFLRSYAGHWLARVKNRLNR